MKIEVTIMVPYVRVVHFSLREQEVYSEQSLRGRSPSCLHYLLLWGNFVISPRHKNIGRFT